MMVAPESVDRYSVESSSFDLFEYVLPELRNWYTPVMELSRPYEETLAIDLEAVVVPLDYFIESIIM